MPVSPPAAAFGPAGEPFDRQRVLVAVDGSIEFLGQMVRILVERDGPRLLDELRRAVDGADSVALAEAAHGLKGLAGELAADSTYELARRLEALGAKGDLAAAVPLVGELEAEFGALIEALTAFVDENVGRSSAPDTDGDGSDD